MVDSFLCRVWADLAARPDAAGVAAAARAHLTDLVFHVPFCEACGIVGETTRFPQKMLDVLASLDDCGLSDEERAEIRAMDTIPAGDDLDDDQIATAAEFLLAGLPDHVSAPVLGLDPVKIFQSIEAIDHFGPWCHGRESAIYVIAERAGVSDAEAESLWNWQREAVKYCPTLYDGPSSDPDLLVRWRIGSPVRSRTQLLDVLAELGEAVAAGTRLLFGVTRARQRKPRRSPQVERRWQRLARELAAENAKIAAMVAALGGDDPGDAAEDSISASEVTMASTLARLRMAERKKQRCLGAIANAAAAVLGRGEDAIRVRRFAAESETAAAYNVMELEEIAKL